MSDRYAAQLDEAIDETLDLVRILDPLGSADRAPQSTLSRVRSLADRIERTLYAAVSAGEVPAAAAFGYQALEGIDSLRAAVDGGDAALMRAAAYEIRDHLVRARDAAAYAPGRES